MKILGISFLSDASAAVVVDGKLLSAVSEERLNRVKQWNGIPHQAIAAALELANISLDQIDLIATHGASPPAPAPRPYEEKLRDIQNSNLTASEKAAQIDALKSRQAHEATVLGERTPQYLAEIKKLGRPVKLFSHHEAHAASAFYGSGWKDCLVLTADGWGEDASNTLHLAEQGKMRRLSLSNTFDSLGYFYGSITKALGFSPHRHEGKVVGLAALCETPASYSLIRSMIDYDKKNRRFVGRMERGLYLPRFENPNLKKAIASFSREDVACSAQRSLEEVVTAYVKDLPGHNLRLALAGGIFANVKLNQRIAELANVAEIFVFPNMGDGGLSVGAAWLAHHEATGKLPEPLQTLYLGPGASGKSTGSVLQQSGLKVEQPGSIAERIAQLLSEDQVVARYHGKMEFGPRALGHRSILYPAKDPGVNQWLNDRLNRSEFMPFAPATLAQHAKDRYVGVEKAMQPARYMAVTFSCTKKMRDESPAAVHVDGTARPQLVNERESSDFFHILTHYQRKTGIPTLINTSFNMHEEPIVCSVEDAIRAVVDGRLPYLAVENFLVTNAAAGLSSHKKAA